MERSIIHINVADFAVAVERLANRQLKNRPVIIAPEGAARATVYDMSEEAYQAGVRKGMALRRARRLSCDACILPPHTARYEQAMADLLRQVLPFSPLIEPGEDDGHLFVDVTGTSRLFGPPVDVAWRLHRQVQKKLELNPIWTLAPNKLIAKVASRLVKPVGEYIVAQGDEASFLSPLPVWLIPGIESQDLALLQAFNITTVRQAAQLTKMHLKTGFGPRAGFLANVLRGIDTTPVMPIGRQPPQIVLNYTFGTDTNSQTRLERRLRDLVEQAGLRLRQQGRATQRLHILVEYSDGRRYSRQIKIQPATANDLALYPFAKHALNLVCHRRVRIRYIRLIFDRLIFPPAQIPLFEKDRQSFLRQENIVAAMDKIRIRFGDHAVKLGKI